MRFSESLLRGIIRETLLTEDRAYADSIHGAYDYWRFKLRTFFQEINGRWPSYREYVALIEDSVPGFKYSWGAHKYPDDTFDYVERGSLGLKLMDEIYRQLVMFIDNDDKKDLQVTRGIESTAKRLRKEAQEVNRKKRSEREERERRETAEREVTYEPKAPPDSPLGKYAFSPQRQMQMNPPPMEKNTPVETALLRSIRNHFMNERPLTRKQAQLATSFIRDGLYPDVFVEPPPGTYYRGMLLHIDDLERMGVDITLIGDSKKLELRGDYEIKPLEDRYSSSWSSSFEVADGFSLGAGARGRTNMYSAVFGATTELNPGKFLDAQGFYDVDLEEDFGYEYEVIGLGTIWANSVNLTAIV